MLKSLNKNDTLNTPFTMTKEWNLSNIGNDDLVLYEHTSSIGGELEVAIEFIDFGNGSTFPFVNSSCSLALEQQIGDFARYREGRKLSGLFYPDTEPKNLDSTYKRMVYNQVQNLFYNDYRDPTKVWGMENIDIDKSQVKKFLQDKFVLLDVPTIIMGEKIVPNTVKLVDDTSDNEYIIRDDGKCNLLIGYNIFSKQQELRTFGNTFNSGSDSTCNSYWKYIYPVTVSQATYTEPASFDVGTYYGWVNTIPVSSSEEPHFSVGLHAGSADSLPEVDLGFDFECGLNSGSTTTAIITASFSDSASFDVSFFTGSLIDIIVTKQSSDSASFDVSFYTGSTFTVVIPTTQLESSPFEVGLTSGSLYV